MAATQGTDPTFDLVILGAGSGGYACALRAAQLGLSVALVEQDRLGGTCLHRGCIPTKAILHAAEVADAARDGGQFGIHATIDKIDLAGVRAYSEGVVSRLYKGLTGLINARAITVVPGRGQLVRQGDTVAVQVADRLLTGQHVVVATGSYARTLPGLEVDGEHILTSDHAIRLDQLPASAIVLGGGVIGVEFASAWRSLGVNVTVVEALPRLVPAEEPQVSTVLERAFRKRKISMVTGVPVREARAHGSGVQLTLEDGQVLEADLLLVAVGRGPASDGIGLAEVGIELDHGYVPVDARLQTVMPHHVRRGGPGPRLPAGPPRVSRTASSWPRTSRTDSVARCRPRYRSTTSRSPGSPTAIPRSPPSG